jgi:fructose-1-phosphate kinase PfkB-like protein
MITVELPAKVTVDDLLVAVTQLPTPELTTFVHRVLSIQAQRGVPLLADEEEAALLQIIENQRLPATVQQRLDQLRALSRKRPLNTHEQAELLTYVQQVEQQDLTRLQALIELAQHRNTTLPALLHELGLEKVHA